MWGDGSSFCLCKLCLVFCITCNYSLGCLALYREIQFLVLLVLVVILKPTSFFFLCLLVSVLSVFISLVLTSIVIFFKSDMYFNVIVVFVWVCI